MLIHIFQSNFDIVSFLNNKNNIDVILLSLSDSYIHKNLKPNNLKINVLNFNEAITYSNASRNNTSEINTMTFLKLLNDKIDYKIILNCVIMDNYLYRNIDIFYEFETYDDYKNYIVEIHQEKYYEYMKNVFPWSQYDFSEYIKSLITHGYNINRLDKHCLDKLSSFFSL